MKSPLSAKATRVAPPAAFLLLLAGLLGPTLLRGQAVLYWDTNDNAPGAGTIPSEDWASNKGAPRRNWTTDATGGSGTEAWIAGSFARFSAGTDATGSFSVTVSQIVSVAGITVEEGSPTISGGSLSFTGATPFITTNTTAAFNTVLTGTAGINLNGTGTVAFNGANTYTGTTSVNAGTLRLGNNSALPSGTAVAVASGATLDLNGYSETVGAVSGAGTIRTNGGSLTLGAGMDFGSGTLQLNGGTLNLGGFSSTLGTLAVTANSILDFGAGLPSTLNVITSITIDSLATLTIQNWADTVDYFYSLYGDPGADVRSRITFAGFTGTGANWIAFDHQITPVPEPSAYGAAMLGLCTLAMAWRSRRKLAA